MRAIWRLSTNALAGRASRTALLVAAVALSVTLVATVACALGTLTNSMSKKLDSSLGLADIRVRELTGTRFDGHIAEIVGADASVAALARTLKAPLPLLNPKNGNTLTPIASGIDPQDEARLSTPELANGRTVERAGEVLLGQYAAAELGAQIGDALEVVRFGDPITLEVVGVIRAQTTLQLVPRTEVTVDRAQLEEATGYAGALSEIKVRLVEGVDAFEVSEALTSIVPKNILVEPTERVTSGLDDTMKLNRYFFMLASVLAFIASSFIILTGLTTGVLERQREFAVMRAIGSARTPIAISQLVVGAFVGFVGALFGIPLGIALAWLLLWYFGSGGSVGLVVPSWGIAMSFGGALGAGVIGSVWPALMAARTSPLRSFSRRAIVPRLGPVLLTLAVAIVCLCIQLATILLPTDGFTIFWMYTTTGMPAMVIGYFLLGVPLVVLVAHVFGPVVAFVLRVPRSLLVSSVSATPYRNGFTAGALMVGLGIMVSTWTQGNAFIDRWLGAMQFPEAFINGPLGLDESDQAIVDGLDFVGRTCAITLLKIETEAFGVRDLKPVKTTFIAFEPDKFFDMVNLHWVAGDPETAMRRVREGGAVIVAKEFLVERDEYEVGDTFNITHRGQTHGLEIVGAVSSPGLDLVRKYFDIGAEYTDQAVHSVFGSREDLKRLFGTDAIHLIQVELRDDATLSDEQVTARLRDALDDNLLAVGSGREIIEGITAIGKRTMRIANFVALGAMLVGCMGVGNIVVASIQARRFEFGVVRSLGAQGTTLARLVTAEVTLIAITACILGTGIGIQGAFAGMRLQRFLAGFELPLEPPLGPIAMGWGILIALTLVFVSPMIWRIARAQPRELLASDG